MKATTHWIELTEDAKPLFQLPHGAGTAQREQENKEIDGMLKEGVIE